MDYFGGMLSFTQDHIDNQKLLNLVYKLAVSLGSKLLIEFQH